MMKKQIWLEAFQISMLYIAGVIGGMLFDRGLGYVIFGNVITFITFLTFYRAVAKKNITCRVPAGGKGV